MQNMRRSFSSVSASLRDLLVSVGPFALLIAALLFAAYAWIKPEPPHSVRMATGPDGSSYAIFGKHYAEQLKPYGITVQLISTAGSAENLQLLREGKADVAFVRGGTGQFTPDDEPQLVSLGSLFYEPLWIFYREAALPRKQALTALPQLAKLRVNVDTAGSGVPSLMDQLFKVNKLEASQLKLSHLPPEQATEALRSGKLDAIVLASAKQSRFVHQMLQSPGIALMDLAQADAYSRLFGFLSEVTLPQGVADLATNVPAHDLTLVAPTTSKPSFWIASARARMPEPEVFSERKSSSMMTMGKLKRSIKVPPGQLGTSGKGGDEDRRAV